MYILSHNVYFSIGGDENLEAGVETLPSNVLFKKDLIFSELALTAWYNPDTSIKIWLSWPIRSEEEAQNRLYFNL